MAMTGIHQSCTTKKQAEYFQTQKFKAADELVSEYFLSLSRYYFDGADIRRVNGYHF